MDAVDKMVIAKVGDRIVFFGGVKGIVQKINENSVIVDIYENNTTEFFRGHRTVVNHKKYTIITD